MAEHGEARLPQPLTIDERIRRAKGRDRSGLSAVLRYREDAAVHHLAAMLHDPTPRHELVHASPYAPLH
eukprot:6436095-Lingulodinium_polyedra.AAC.1